MLRVIRELKPTWVLGENVPGIVNLALDTVLADLEKEGYATQAFIVPACAVDAPHRRDRVAILAHSESEFATGRNVGSQENTIGAEKRQPDYRTGISDVRVGERRENKPGAAGMADGIRKEIYGASADTDSEPIQGNSTEKIFRGGYYHNQLHELIESTPLGIIGRMNPEYVEWLMGYPIGWTELSV